MILLWEDKTKKKQSTNSEYKFCLFIAEEKTHSLDATQAQYQAIVTKLSGKEQEWGKNKGKCCYAMSYAFQTQSIWKLVWLVGQKSLPNSIQHQFSPVIFWFLIFLLGGSGAYDKHLTI